MVVDVSMVVVLVYMLVVVVVETHMLRVSVEDFLVGAAVVVVVAVVVGCKAAIVEVLMVMAVLAV